MGGIRIGSEDHKRLLCATFLQTHDPFLPEQIAWPVLDEEALARIRALPVWMEAARTEAATAVKVQALGEIEPDPVLKEAIGLQGYDARRAWNIAAQAFDRVRGAMAMGRGGSSSQDGFTLKSHAALGDFSLRSFLELCLSENQRRLAPYDARLLRPALVPSTVRALLK